VIRAPSPVTVNRRTVGAVGMSYSGRLSKVSLGLVVRSLLPPPVFFGKECGMLEKKALVFFRAKVRKNVKEGNS